MKHLTALFAILFFAWKANVQPNGVKDHDGNFYAAKKRPA
jgi:hypothetical protein